MAQGKITKRPVDALMAGTRPNYLWDADLPGFGLKVTPAGRKVYLVQYRLGGRRGRTRRVTLGLHGPLTPDQARREAKRVLAEVARGRDPAGDKAKAKKDLTISELCEIYLAEGTATKKLSTVRTDRSNVVRHIVPVLGAKKLASLSRADVERLLRDVSAGRTALDVKMGPRARAIVRGGKGIANRAREVLSAVLTFALDRGYRVDNPARGIKRFSGKKMERFLSGAELARLGEALAAAQKEGINPAAVNAIRLLVMTGCRKGEILGLRWEWIDHEHGCIRLPDSKTGPKVVPLGNAALELLSTLPHLDGNPHVLPGSRAGGHYVGLQKAWQRIRKSAGLPGVRLHDLRHSFASIAVASGESLFLTGKLLGHRQSRTTEGYAHLQADPVRGVADRTSARISAALKGGVGGAAVVRLAGRKG